jgi:hypothetical protein
MMDRSQCFGEDSVVANEYEGESQRTAVFMVTVVRTPLSEHELLQGSTTHNLSNEQFYIPISPSEVK